MSTWVPIFTANQGRKGEIRTRHVESWPTFNELSPQNVDWYEGTHHRAPTPSFPKDSPWCATWNLQTEIPPQGSWAFSKGKAPIGCKLDLRREKWEKVMDIPCASANGAAAACQRLGTGQENREKSLWETLAFHQVQCSSTEARGDWAADRSLKEQDQRAKRTVKWPRKLEAGCEWKRG